ncbi:hypothetical protein HWV62_7569 [Athelia sp. TMB]|nr:hypothetical protein HWV62_7569 [Athelia sp. TMB]
MYLSSYSSTRTHKMPYKNIAVIGAGNIGAPIAKALLAEGANVIVVSRAESKHSKNLPSEIKVVSVSLTDVSALAALFKEHKIEVVVSTVAHEALPHQHLLADAAKQAGVKLFVPSEFGYSTLGITEGELGIKAQFGEYIEKIGLPFTRIFVGPSPPPHCTPELTCASQNGGFISYIPWLLGVSTGNVQILGNGDKKATFTDIEDIAGFVAYVLTHLTPSELENKYFRIQGESASFVEIAEYYKLPVERVTAFGGPDGPFRTLLHRLIESGKGSVGYSALVGKELTAGESNALWKGHHWKGIKEGLGL